MPAIAPNMPGHFSWSAWRVLAMVACACLGLALSDCSKSSWPTCGPSGACACSEGEECFLGCYSGSCSLECHNTQAACGTICADQCTASCHDTTDCSHSCGERCVLQCHNTKTCAASCGANCDYTCHDITECGVRVGPNSSVTCHHANRCIVECAGPCTVRCFDVSAANGCSVTCGGQTSLTNDNGTYTCR